MANVLGGGACFGVCGLSVECGAGNNSDVPDRQQDFQFHCYRFLLPSHFCHEVDRDTGVGRGLLRVVGPDREGPAAKLILRD
jgi:hypothetical protein